MRKWLLASAGMAAVALAVAGGFFLSPALVRARPEAAKQDNNNGKEDGPKQASVPLTQVVLFSSGVGYFQREGSVTDDSRVDLAFDTRDINDLLKSMVLR